MRNTNVSQAARVSLAPPDSIAKARDTASGRKGKGARRIALRMLAATLLCLHLAAGQGMAEFVFPGETQPDGAAAQESILFVDATAEAPQADEGVEILISAAGDVTLGGNMRGNVSSNMYTKLMAKIDGNLAHFFAGVWDIFAQDDLTLVNFEGTLTLETAHSNDEFTFRAPPEHAQILTLGSVEAVSFENNHVKDFLEKGYQDTLVALSSYGIVYATEAHMGVYEVKGVSIAMLAYQLFGNQYARLHEQMPKDIAAAKEAHDIVIVSYHWGNEGEFAPHDRQVTLGRATIDAGADLVLGHHSHRINPIEHYNGRYIVYSLANCSFSGNTKPANMDTFIFQQKFHVQDGAATPGAFRIIPCSISSITAASGAVSGENDLAITPFAPGSDAAQRVIDTMLENSKGLDYAVGAYPTEWE